MSLPGWAWQLNHKWDRKVTLLPRLADPSLQGFDNGLSEATELVGERQCGIQLGDHSRHLGLSEDWKRQADHLGYGPAPKRREVRLEQLCQSLAAG
jgi:hypothetical protein